MDADGMVLVRSAVLSGKARRCHCMQELLRRTHSNRFTGSRDAAARTRREEEDASDEKTKGCYIESAKTRTEHRGRRRAETVLLHTTRDAETATTLLSAFSYSFCHVRHRDHGATNGNGTGTSGIH